MSFYNYKNRRIIYKNRGLKITEKLVFYGTGAEIPRTIVLGSSVDIVRAEDRKKGRVFQSGIEVTEDFCYADRFAYLCKNGSPNQPIQKQLLVCLVSLCEPERVGTSPISTPRTSTKTEFEFIKSLDNQNPKIATVYSINDPVLLLPVMLIEYFSKN